MSDTARHDHTALLLADAERALDGLRLSLDQPLHDMPQAALHALDLASALSRMGWATQADVLQVMSQQLSLGQPMVLSLTQDIVKDLRTLLLERAPSSVRSESPEVSSRWIDWRNQLSAPMSSAHPPWSGVTPTPGALPPIAGYATLSSDSTSAHPVRQHNMDLLQHARMLNTRSDETSRRALDAVLAELQDRTCRLDQVPLRNLYNQAHHQVDDAWADQDIVRGLQQLQPMALRSRQIQVECRGLLVFITWLGLTLSVEERHQVGKVLQRLGGSLIEQTQGVRLCLPSSVRRMSCMAFTMAGRRYAVSAAQCPDSPLSSTPSTEDSHLNLRLGDQALTLKMETWLGCHPMNLHPIPHGVRAPDGVSSVALDGEGRVYLWFDRVS